MKTMKVLLQDVIDAIEQTTNELHFFYYMPEEVILCYSEFDQRILGRISFLLSKIMKPTNGYQTVFVVEVLSVCLELLLTVSI